MERDGPFAQYSFVVEIDNVTIADFTEVGGVNTETDVAEKLMLSLSPGKTLDSASGARGL